LTKTHTVSIIGASGYAGAELLRILSRHRHCTVRGLYAGSSAGQSLTGAYQWQKEYAGLQYEEFEPSKLADSEAVFLALPPGEAAQIIPSLSHDQLLIDLSGDLRLTDSSEYETYYGRQHAGALTSKAIYGLPEWNRSSIGSSRLISNPGCYATSAILPLAPLLADGLIEPDGIVINSMSGVSGAGRKAALELNFTEVNETVKAYRVGDHQHIPEIRNALESATGKKTSFVFVPHLIPITRGIYTTITASAASMLDPAKVAESLGKHYDDDVFVRWHASAVPEIRNVVHTNFCDIGFRVIDGGKKIVLMSVIDNLGKGAAGQAVQNMNIACGFEEGEGLL